ncbi:hypothetical protein QNI16_05620 [Cytophagaceae bacterium YF14B1]|uniref:Uncharacterized protein n=1 Tax=Xanthocytophaga flava TaxID=3048013 RepID=A0AAE3U564_9BACT|nr:hypothetical protein [Xanthocytophaga flavus]MDJ1479956.1 hypothetical protein [Xanthocytophaga flavus]
MAATDDEETLEKRTLIGQLTRNGISHGGLNKLMEAANVDDIQEITKRVFDLNEADLLRKIAIEGIFKKLNTLKNSQRNERYFAKIHKSFRSGTDNKVVFVEGDSWFNYPIILSDIVDWIAMDKKLAVYSSAAGGDWLLNMLATREYVDGLSIHQPDFFLLSGGGNDIAGMLRLALMVNVKKTSRETDSAFRHNLWAQHLIEHSYGTVDKNRWENAIPWISKDFFALLMLFRLQYYSVLKNLLIGSSSPSKFQDLTIITQGYDYLLPSFNSGWGIKPWLWYVPVLRWIGHGKWLKRPLMIRGINDEQLQKDILYVMVFLFNEMLIELGHYFWQKGYGNRVFHIDSRDWIQEGEWTDEIHPKPYKFKAIADRYIDCINGKAVSGHPVYKNVYKVL